MGFLSVIKENWELAKLQKRLAKLFPSFKEQRQWLDKFKTINQHVENAHNQSDIMRFLLAILELPQSIEGCIVEAGAFKGGGTAKISLATSHVNRELFVFDSFLGLPENDEQHDKSVTGYSIKDWFSKGKFFGTLEEVKENVTKYGDISVCNLIPGWFEETLPDFQSRVALAYLDVDLASSTRTCLKFLYPLLSPSGAIYSQDGDFPLVIEVFKDEKFWIEEVGCEKLPEIVGIGKKITVILK